MLVVLCWINFQDFMKALRHLGYCENDDIYIGALSVATALQGSMVTYVNVYQMAVGMCAFAKNNQQMYGIAAFALSFWPPGVALPDDDKLLRAIKDAVDRRLIPQSLLPVIDA